MRIKAIFIPMLAVLALTAVARADAPVSTQMAAAEKLIAARQFDSAEKIIVSQMMSAPRNADWITLLAEVRFEQMRLREALQLIGGADRIGGVTVRRAMLASMIESAAGRLDLAEQQVRAAIQLDPTDAYAHYALSRLLYTRNVFDEAIAESQKTIALVPGFVRAYENIGLCYEGKHEPREAEHWYREAIRHDATSAVKTEWPLLDLATMMIHQGRYAEAKPLLTQALEINPHNAQSLLETGILLEKTGNPKEALDRYRAAIQDNPRLAGAYYQAARLCKRLGYNQEAAEDFKRFSDLQKRQP